MRRYRTGSRWALWRWTNLDYLIRLHLFKTPWFSVYLHWILKPDPRPDLHDHPVDFLSIILRGAYGQLTPLQMEDIRWCNLVRKTTIHRICYVERPCLTLCLAWHPHPTEWGFYTPEGRVSWKEYK